MSEAPKISFNHSAASYDSKYQIAFLEKTIENYKIYMRSDIRRACYWREEIRKAEKDLKKLKTLP